MRATITIPDDRLAELLWLSGTSNRTEAINAAIEAYVRRRKIERLLAVAGQVDVLSNDEIERADVTEVDGGAYDDG